MTAVTGRRRIGKTKLILRSCEGTPTLYLFVSRSSEAALCAQFAGNARQALGVFIPAGIQSFVELFEQLMVIGQSLAYNLIIDEFQEFFNINASVFSGIQDVWDRYKDSTHVNMIASGSVYSLMHRIFMEYAEPLYGRCDTIIRLKPFQTSVLKEILVDYNDRYSNDDLLTLYMITGGVPKYIEILMDRGANTAERMIECTTQENSIFLEEGNILLAQEFGKKFGNYYSILSAIAGGRNTAALISQEVGDSNLGGMLKRLEEDYELISRKRPILSKERSQNVRYEIADNFLRFWFRYIARNQELLQMELNQRLRDIIIGDYPTYSGLVLERWFRQKLVESGNYKSVGAWWNNAKGRDTDQCEIDIVALPLEREYPVLVAEVKRQLKNFKPEAFSEKVEYLKTKVLYGLPVKTECLTLEDM